jgi:cell wall-associated NlpC family hydrolase
MKKLSQKEKDVLRQNVVGFAEKFVGIPYKYGATLKDAPQAFDCSGFIQYVYKNFGYEIPRSTILQAEFIKKTIAGIKNIQVGDLIYLHGEKGYYTKKYPAGIGHVAMYIGNKEVIHANGRDKNGGVKIEKMIKVIETRRPLVVIKRII